MYLTSRSAWLAGVGLLLVLLVPRPLTAVTWSAVVMLLTSQENTTDLK